MVKGLAIETLPLSPRNSCDLCEKEPPVKKRTHSLYRQGLYGYQAILIMGEEWLRRLMEAFDRIVREHAFFSYFFEVVGARDARQGRAQQGWLAGRGHRGHQQGGPRDRTRLR